MCILFVYNGNNDVDSDYSLIIATNRDEFYDRPSASMAPWSDYPDVLGGLDLEQNCLGGTWLAVSTEKRKMGVLLNLLSTPKENAKSRGKIVAEFVKNNKDVNTYIEDMKLYFQDCNNFVLVTLEFDEDTPATIHSFSNSTNIVLKHTEPCLGFGNSLPENPLKKVEAGTAKMENICKQLNKISMKNKLKDELIALLRCSDRYLPDLQLQEKRPKLYKELSSIFVCVPEGRYGTRAQTILLLSKTGYLEILEISMMSPISATEPVWEKHQYQYQL